MAIDLDALAGVLARSLAAARAASRISGQKNSYRKDNPAEYAKIVAYLDGGPRPFGALTKMGEHLVLEEDVRIALVKYQPLPPTTFAADKYASPTGSDSNPGTLAAPYATLVKLAQNLTPGQTGALRGGTYGDINTEHSLTGHSGTAASAITYRGYPGEAPLIKGRVYTDNNYVTFSHLTFDGTNTLYDPSNCGQNETLAFGIYGDNVIIEHNEYYQGSGAPKGSCFYIENGNGVIIRYNKIHDWGSCFDYDHGVYSGHGTGIDVHHNWFWNTTSGWGIQVYPASVNGTYHHNVIDACGSGFIISDNGTATCTGNQVYNNVIVNSVGLTTQSSFHITGAGLSGSGVVAGTNNSFTDNDCFANPGGVGSAPNVTVSGNITTDPLFVDAPNHNYAIQPGSPVAGWGLWDGT